MMHNEEMISLELAQSKVPDRYSFHLGLLRNQVVMPPLKDAINNADFMQGIIEGRYWHLRSHEIQYRVCADMPSKKELADILYRVMQEDEKGNIPAFRATAELVKAKPPSPEWLVLMIGSLKPDHAIFDKGYVKPKVFKAGAASAIVQNFGGFFNGLPNMERKRGAGRVNFVSKAVREQEKLDKLRMQQELV